MDPKAFIAAVEAAWRSRADMPAEHRLTRLHVHIAAKLAFWRGSGSPSHRKLAKAAGCSKRTVQRALARLHLLELLSWTRRVVRGRGWRALISNTYHFLSNTSLNYQYLMSSVRLSPSAPAPATAGAGSGATDLLAARRAVNEARLRAAYAARWGS